MLRLINALEMPREYVIEYKYSYQEEIESQLVPLIDKDYEEYAFLVRYILLYYLVDDTNPTYILGDVSIKHLFLNPNQNEGNIGYEIRKTERGKGYGNLILSLALDECAKMDMDKVSISCVQTNTRSEKVILKNGGEYDLEWYDKQTNEMVNKYWINLEKHKVKKLI